MVCVCVYRNDFYLEFWSLKYVSFFIYVEICLEINVEVLREIVARWFWIVTQFVLRSLEWAIGNIVAQREGIVTRLLDNSQFVRSEDLQSWHDGSTSWHNISEIVLYKASFFIFLESFKRENLGKSKEITLGLGVFDERFSWVGETFVNTLGSEISLEEWPKSFLEWFLLGFIVGLSDLTKG